MRARIVIEYHIPNGDRIALRDREEQMGEERNAPCYAVCHHRIRMG
jgi:hypothetical protein